jgi:hypothetical protein
MKKQMRKTKDDGNVQHKKIDKKTNVVKEHHDKLGF